MQSGCLHNCSFPDYALQGRQGHPSTAPAATSSGQQHCRQLYAHGRQHTHGQGLGFQILLQRHHDSRRPVRTAVDAISCPALHSSTPMDVSIMSEEAATPEHEQQQGGWAQRVLSSMKSTELLPPGLYLVATPIGNLVRTCTNARGFTHTELWSTG